MGEPVLRVMVVVLLAYGLRLHGLADWPISPDEAFTLTTSRLNPPELLASLLHDADPPFHYLAARAVSPFIPDAYQFEFVVRLLSVSFDLLSTCLVFALARRMFGPRAGVLAALFFAVSPVQIAVGREARMHALNSLISLAATYCLWRAWGKAKDGKAAGRTRGHWLGFTALTLLNFYTKYTSFFLLMAQDLWAISSRPWERRRLLLLAASQLIAAGFFLLYLPRFLVAAATVPPAVTRPSLLHLAVIFADYLIVPVRSYPLHVAALFVALLLFGITVARGVRMARLPSPRGRAALLLLCLSLAPTLILFAISQQTPVLAPWRVVSYVPFFYVLAAEVLHSAPSPIRRGGMAAWIGLAVVVLAAQSVEPGWGRPDFRHAAAQVSGSLSPGDRVIGVRCTVSRPLNHYLAPTVVPCLSPAFVSEPLGPVPVREVLAGAGRVWFVMESADRGLFEAAVTPDLPGNYHLDFVGEPRGLVVLRYAGAGAAGQGD